MGRTRRNALGYQDAMYVAVVAAVAGVLAALAGCRPTGSLPVDVVMCALAGGVVTWLTATAPWWALLAAAAIALAGSLGGPLLLSVLAVAAVGAAGWIGSTRANQPVVRAGIGGAVVQVVLRFEIDPFFAASALVAAAALLLLAVTGAQRRQRYVRRRIVWTTVAVAALAVLAAGGMGVAGLQHRESFTDGYRTMLRGLDHVQAGDIDAARDALLDAADDLDEASEGFGGPIAQPARLVPGVAQNRTAAVEVLGRAGDAARTAADALAVVDLDQLRLTDGVIDVAALAALEVPFEQLEVAVNDLWATLADADSPWLVGPVQDRLATSRDRADQLGPQATALASAARNAPAMLGADEPRRYLLAFVNPAEARAHSGLMGNWSELTIDDGRLRITRNGRTAQLQSALNDENVFVDQPPEFFDRLGPVGAGDPPEVPVQPDLWANITSSPDMATVGPVMATMYEAEAGHPVDGVFVIDPAGIAALLRITGPIEIDQVDEELTADNVEQFLLLDQYELPEGEREILLQAVTETAIDRVLTSTLPAPQELVRSMADAALHGHISAWADDADEQALFRQVGMDATLPRVGPGAWTGDALAVLTDNGNPNKIDSFLHREIDYDVVVDRDTGAVEATLRVTLRNEAPARGYEDYVIGNTYGFEPGSNRTVLTIMTPHELVEFRNDGVEQIPVRGTELGWNTHQMIVVVPSDGGTVTLEAELRGEVPPESYSLFLRPQPLPNPDRLDIRVVEREGAEILHRTEPILRRRTLDASGAHAWR